MIAFARYVALLSLADREGSILEIQLMGDSINRYSSSAGRRGHTRRTQLFICRTNNGLPATVVAAVHLEAGQYTHCRHFYLNGADSGTANGERGQRSESEWPSEKGRLVTD